jgi:hypothetical protein
MRRADVWGWYAGLLLWACSPADAAPRDGARPVAGQAGSVVATGDSAGTVSASGAAGLLATGGLAPVPAGVGAIGLAGSGAFGGSGGGGGAKANAGSSAGGGGAGRASAAAGGAIIPAGAGAGAAGAGGAAGGCTQNLTCQLPAAASSGDPRQDCVDRINQFRTQCACLPALARWTDGEACADMMAMYDSAGTTAHAGFIAKICSGGNAQNECPGWPSEAQVVSGCLQQMWNEGPPNMTPCSGTCFQTYGHFINMTNTRNKKVACGFFKTTAGKLWSVQNFSP